MEIRSVKILVAAAALFVIASPVMAGIEFNDGGVWDIDYKINNDVWVDWESPGMGTTVNMLTGGGITGSYDLKGFEGSTLNILGGAIDRSLRAYDSSQVAVSGGAIDWYICAYDSSHVTVSGGSIEYGLYAYHNSHVTVSGGARNWLNARGDSQVTISGGAMRWLYALYSSQVTVSGGSINENLYAWDSSQVTLSGGSIGGELRLYDNAVLTIDGSDFAVDGTEVGYIELSSILGGNYQDESYRRLTGTLLNGGPLDNDFRIGHSAKIALIPEPATLLLLGLGGLTLLRKHRRK